MYETRCRICDNLLFVSPRVSNRASRRLGGPVVTVELELDATGHSFRCPYCSARNVLLRSSVPGGDAPIQVAWAILGGD